MVFAKSKKNQVSIFVIIAIILLFSSAVFLFVKEQIDRTISERAISQIESVSGDFEAVQEFTVSCLHNVLKEGILRAGLNGGYPAPDDPDITPRLFAFSEFNPTESDGVVFFEGSDIKVPYWYHLSSKNNCRDNCEYGANIPVLVGATENSLETQLGKYIDKHIGARCILNYQIFRDQGFEFDIISSPKTKVNIGGFVTAEMKYEIVARKGGQEQKMAVFLAKQNVNLPKVFETAVKITNIQMETSFLEFNTLNLLSGFGDSEKNKLPPMAQTDFDSSPVFWIKRDVESNVRGILMSYVPVLQVADTSNYVGNVYKGGNKVAEALYRAMILPIQDEKSLALIPYEIDFAYLDWPVYFDVKPSSGQLIQPENKLGAMQGVIQKFIPFVRLPTIWEYKFAYDLSYPVVISITDRKALQDDDFVLNFALEANIRNNDRLDVENPPVSLGFEPTNTFACDFDMRTSKNVSIKLRNGKTGMPVAGAEIYFGLGEENCFIGFTNAIGEFVGQFPVGIGILQLKKEDYLSSTKIFGTNTEEERNEEIIIYPYQQFNEINFVKYNVKRTRAVENEDSKMMEVTWSLVNQPDILNEDEYALVFFERVPENDYDDAMSQILMIKGSKESPGWKLQDCTPSQAIDEIKDLRLAPGKYKMSVMLLQYVGEENCMKDYLIPERTIKPEGADEEITLDEVLFDSVIPTGGGIQDYEVEFTPEIIYSSDTIHIKGIGIDFLSISENSRYIEDLEAMSKPDEIFSKNPQLFLPQVETTEWQI